MALSLGTWVAPTCQPIDWLSYSAWSALRVCPLRTAFSRDPQFRSWERGNPSSALGIARHRITEVVTERLSMGASPPSPQWVRGQFDALLQTLWEQLAEQWAPAIVPPVKKWPDVSYVRTRLVRQLSSGSYSPENDDEWRDVTLSTSGAIGHGHAVHGQAAPAPPAPGQSLSEESLWDTELRLYGWVDRIENRDGKLVVVDLKTGVSISADQLVSMYRNQMLFYAGLVHAVYGQWPQLEITPASCQAVAIQYTPGQVENLRHAAGKDRAAFNAGLAEDDRWSMARPSGEACAWCPFQVTCSAFLDSTAPVTDAGQPIERSLSVVAGVVTAVSRHTGGTDVILVQDRDLALPSGEIAITRLPEDLVVEAGDTLIAARLESSGGTRVLRCRWDTRVQVTRADGTRRGAEGRS